MLTATRTNGHEVRVHNRLQYARWEHKQARLGAGLGMLAAVVAIGVVVSGAQVLAEWRDGRLPNGTGATHERSQQAVSAIRWVSPIAGER